MAKRTRAEIEAELAALDADDDDDEVELGFADGSHFRGRMSRARKVAAARGFKLEPDEDGGDKDQGDDKGKAGGTRFAGRRVS